MEKKEVAILMGSKSDWDVMKDAVLALEQFGIGCETRVLSAHRAPGLVIDFIKESEKNGISVFICGAGGAAHLAGLVAAHTSLPVIGIPVSSGSLNGMDSLLSTVQMPKGIPVATVAINGAYNAGLLAVQILSVKNETLRNKICGYKNDLQEKVKDASSSLQKELSK